ncbi:M20/M25/M40 family metallo-hydrolase [Kribbella albertanoniae]|uniref:M20/M25/M40 family metallo-hydrolase n=1 Tax=Kribbella albertanoniae TaxID=1266829 RepID=A0A4R4Q6T8_9ACTN|nr:M20/M25/M40 family metallo-hydrolase [Kribbella albertanoniae]TDC30887.1 M20/M25/M40 family metallo-hydrolase [Kribbella albertanoniae]
MKRTALRTATVGGVLSLALLATAVITTKLPAADADASAAASRPDPRAAAIRTADRLVEGRAAELKAGSGDRFIRQQDISTPWGLQYVAYQRTYQDLAVIGGDFVITTDAAGNAKGITVAQQQPIALDRTPTVTKTAARKTALKSIDKAEPVPGEPTLVVYAGGAKPVLAWEARVQGRDEGEATRQKVYVDARSGKVVHAIEESAAGTGTGIWNGPNLTIGTTQSGSTYTMVDPARPSLRCGNQSTGTTFSGPDDTWGSTSKTDREAGCVDVMNTAAGEWDMLKSWYGRNGLDNQGKWADALVGLGDINAYWGSQYNPDGVVFGYNNANNWITGIDVVAHEYGHGLDANTPGGISGHPSQESVADIWGALTEAYLNNPNDAPDYEVGEKINLQGNGPIRYMYQPSKVSGHPDCNSSSLPSSVHAAAGPMNHWFYLLAEGTNPGNGKPTSPTCNNTTLTGIGIKDAGKIFYNAMLSKTSGMSYGKWRSVTLNAAKNLDSSCAWHGKVKAAWDAVSVPAQSGEASCAPTGNDFTLSVSPASGSAKPGESVSATVNTVIGSGSAQTVRLTASGLPSGATASFDPASVQSGNSSTLRISTTSSTPEGAYDVRITGDGVDVDRTATYRLTVGGSAPPADVPNIDVEKVKAHLQALQTAADNNGGHRRAGSAGYTASVSYIEGKLRDAGFTVAKQRCTNCQYPSDNLIADYPGGDANQVIMLGAHLDSVSAGPGSNDNASGSAAILEVALALAQQQPTLVKHVRFAWWTDEEQGLNGSEFYVAQLPTADRSKIKAYLNFDMVASTNAGYFVNNITTDAGKVLKAFYDGLNLAPEENTEGAGRSDDASFKNAGIPTSGVASGASARKTSAQAQKWGGTAGSAYDPCYHAACDKYPTNIAATVLDRSADAAAYGLWKLAIGEPPTGSDFSLSLDPASGSVAPGNSVQTTVKTATTSGDPQSVQLAASGLPSGVTATFSPTSVTSGSSSTLTIAASASTAAGTYDLVVKGTGAVSHESTYRLTVTGSQTGTVTVQNPGNQFGFVGWSSFPLQIRATSSAGLPITFTATGLPPGLTISSSGSITGMPTTRGTYSATVTGKDSGGATGKATFSYTIY